MLSIPSRRFPELVRPAIPAALLVTVALLQIYRFYVDDLTPWKGGGFGMFAAIESGSSRVPQLYLVRIGAEQIHAARVPIPEHDRELRRLLRELRVAASESNFKAALDRIAELEFGFYPDLEPTNPTFSEADVARILEPRDVSGVKPAAPAAPRYRLLAKGAPGTQGKSPTAIPYDALRLELWKLEFIPDEPALKARLHRGATIPRLRSIAFR